MAEQRLLQTCPECNKAGLPRIDPASRCNAVMCKFCNKVIDRKRIKA